MNLTCAACQEEFLNHKKKKYCSRASCQRARNQEKATEFLERNPDYFKQRRNPNATPAEEEKPEGDGEIEVGKYLTYWFIERDLPSLKADRDFINNKPGHKVEIEEKFRMPSHFRLYRKIKGAHHPQKCYALKIVKGPILDFPTAAPTNNIRGNQSAISFGHLPAEKFLVEVQKLCDKL